MEYYQQVFDPSQPAPGEWAGQQFEQCTFRKLDLSGQALTKAGFVDCRFEDCTLSRVTLKETKLYDVVFMDCRLPHVDFGACDPFGFHVDFSGCRLDSAVFTDRKMKKSRFEDCSLREAFFLNCELVGVLFRNCNLEGARFDRNDLSQADFTTSYHLRLDPDANRLKKAKFSLYNLPGLLSRYDLVIKE
ncbi:pentapeptide repeat-containing protein [Larkinella soli]|uniref:pentapeptide repeat-containing protein n=1 Tax=Larkinella soli TaxID=1770527 RepID=UPI000FFB9A93|nr:pentapeptide repeat-containing protein [Larkinella soli]